MVEFRWVTPGYFRTLGIPILSGREFEEGERASGESPVILSAALARRLFGAENPIGQQIGLDGDGRWCSPHCLSTPSSRPHSSATYHPPMRNDWR
jgi:hypothetical protein